MASQNIISILIQAKDEASKVLKDISSNTGKASDDAQKAGGGFAGMWKQVAVGEIAAQAVEKSFGFLKDQFTETLKAGQEQEQVMSQLNAVLSSTGHAAGLTAQDIEGYAKNIAKTTPVENDAAIGAENMLLTFTNIKKTQFGGATQAVVDMATAMNGGATPAADQLRQTAILVGKALNDPTQGMTALRRVGVSFSSDQQKVIGQLQATGQTAKAQQMILTELNKEFGGSGAKALGTFGGKMEQLQNTMHDLRESIGTTLMDALTPFLEKAATFVESVNWDSVIEKVSGAFYSLTDAITSVARVIGDALVAAFNAWKPQLEGIWNGLQKLMPTLKQLWEQILVPLLKVVGVVAVIAWKAQLEAINLLIPVINAVGKAILATVQFFEKHHAAAVALGGAIAALGAVFLASLIPPIIASVVAFGGMAIAAASAAVATIIAFAPIVIIGAVVAAVVYEVVSHWKQISSVAKAVVADVAGFFKKLGEDLKAIWNDIKAAVKAVWDFLYNNVIKYYIELMVLEFTIIKDVVMYVFDVIRGLAIVAWQFIYNVAVKPIMDLIKLEIQGLVNIFNFVWGIITAVTSAVWSFLWNVVIAPVFNAISAAFNFIAGVAGVVGNAIGNAFAAAFNWVRGIWNGVTGWFGSIFGSIVGAAGGIAGGIANAFSNAMNGAKNIVIGAVNWIIDRINSVIHGVNNTAGKLPGVPHIGDIPHLASGGVVGQGGVVRVGEFGAEDVMLPAGAVVRNATDTARAGGGGVNLTVNVPVHSGTQTERQAYAVSIGQEIVKALRAQGLNINQIGSLR